MQKIAKFYIVSDTQFKRDIEPLFPTYSNAQIQAMYDQIKLPKRATTGSAGYDFYAPFPITLAPQQTCKVPTGIRVKMSDGWVLTIHPRSSLGFKYRLQMDNTTGIIDQDYYASDNEGHIFVKLTNDSKQAKTIQLEIGDAIVQGIFLPFGICEDDEVSSVRNGGFGSTNT